MLVSESLAKFELHDAPKPVVPKPNDAEKIGDGAPKSELRLSPKSTSEDEKFTTFCARRRTMK